jgi:hypothetical protein
VNLRMGFDHNTQYHNIEHMNATNSACHSSSDNMMMMLLCRSAVGGYYLIIYYLHTVAFKCVLGLSIF